MVTSKSLTCLLHLLTLTIIVTIMRMVISLLSSTMCEALFAVGGQEVFLIVNSLLGVLETRSKAVPQAHIALIALP